MSPYVIAMGANPPAFKCAVGELSRARSALGRGPIRVVAASSLWRTAAYPRGSGPDFANAVLVVRSGLGPEALLRRLHEVEAAAGRSRRRRWGARALDLDLLASGAEVRPDADTLARWMALPGTAQRLRAPRTLLLPHPRLHERAFVLAPMAEIVPGWRHPLTGRSAAEMLRALPGAARASVRRLPLRWGMPLRAGADVG
jgi:2-amino-4-hydroxy-6-hydroxymethyldihydropteridine diphosphokinase